MLEVVEVEGLLDLQGGRVENLEQLAPPAQQLLPLQQPPLGRASPGLQVLGSESELARPGKVTKPSFTHPIREREGGSYSAFRYELNSAVERKLGGASPSSG
jgi:hypothetical protein